MPALSAGGFQERPTCEEDCTVAVRPVGTFDGGGVTVLLTVTVIEEEVIVFPAASRAVAVRVWVPLVAWVVFQVVEYGEEVSSEERLVPSSLN